MNQRPNILIVDDIDENLFHLETIIKKIEVNLIKAKSGIEALEKTKDVDLALAIIDVWMPEMNGYELAVKLNKNKTDNIVPIIFLTASMNNETELLKGYNAGAVDYIFKPVNNRILTGKIKIFTELYNQKQTIIENALLLKQSTEVLTKVNKSLIQSEEKEKKLTLELKNTLDNLEKLVDVRTEELTRSEELYYTTVNSFNSWVFVVDEQLKILFLNAKIIEFFNENGLQVNALNKNMKDVFLFLNEDNFAHYEKVINEQKEFEYFGSFEISGKIYFTQTILSPIIRNNKVIRIVTTVHDQSKQKLIEEDIKKNLNREKELNALKSQFISTVSHEFRTPLAGIYSSVQLLKLYNEKWDEKKREKFFKQIFDSIRQTIVLLDDVSIINRGESNSITIKPKLINLQDLLNEIINDNIQVYGKDKIILKSFHLGKSQHYLDPEIIRYIFGNVLSNALKYSGSSKKIVFNVIEEKYKLTFKIIDYGIGIPVKDQRLLFTPFYRASNVESIPGTGFGLSIVKRLVDLLDGSVEIVSEIKKGTTVNISLPYIYNE